MSIETCLVDYRAETVLKAIWCVGQNMKKYLSLKKPAHAYKKYIKFQNDSNSENEVKYSLRQLELTLQSFLATKEMFLSFSMIEKLKDNLCLTDTYLGDVYNTRIKLKEV